MDTFNIFYSNALNTTLTVCATVTLVSAFLTLSLFVGPKKQYLHFAHVVANTRTLWDRLNDRDLEADVGRHAIVILRPSGIAKVPRSWWILELLYLTLKIVRLQSRLQALDLVYQEKIAGDSSLTPTSSAA
ncbi:hypothetical protein BJ912DRAFT_1145832 [Pholiota molesta]|nr:hypothetical protein BJ912DRAFT_1145832 [Pholiota molesta]